jgi:hypothetical protein
MNMKHLSNKLKTVVVLFSSVCLFSCNEDKGNYDYNEINEVIIEGLEGPFAFEIGDTKTLIPTLTFSQEEDEDLFTYTWYYYDGGKWEAIYEGRDLELEISGRFGKPTETDPYRLAYEIVNKKTQIPYRKLFTFTVITPLSRGYVALCEKEDGFEIDLIAYPTTDKFTLYKNVLDLTGSSLPRKGVKPYDIVTFPDVMAPDPYNKSGTEYSVYVLTDQYTTRIKSADYSWLPAYDISNSIEPNSHLDKEYIKKGKSVIVQQMKTGYVNVGANTYVRSYIYHKEEDGTGNWYVCNRWPSWYFYSAQMNRMRPEGDNRYEPAPYIAVGATASMFFDTDSKSFKIGMLPHNGNMQNSTDLFYTEAMTEAQDGVFNFNDSNNGLLYMGERLATNVTDAAFAILKQPDGTYKYMEFGLASLNKDGISAKGNKKRVSHFVADSRIEDAKFFASAPYSNSPWIFYVTNDNKVFKANLSQSTAVVTDITSSILKDDGYNEITTFKYLLPRTHNWGAPVQTSLAVGTYNTSKGKNEGGKLEFFLMTDATSGEISLAKFPANPREDGYQIDMSWDGLGKIVGLDFKEK